MAADVSAKQELVNPCCSAWKERCVRYKEKRDALREVVKLFEQQFDKIQAKKLSLEKAYEEERARVEVEKEGKEKELAARVLLENEIYALKSEISILQQNVGSNSRSVEEVKLLKQVLEKEKVRTSSAKKNAEVEKKNAAEAWKHVEAEKNKADEERRLANVEGMKAEEYRLQLESLCKEADNAKSKLVAEVLKSEDLSKKLESSALKSEISILQQNVGSNSQSVEEVKLLEVCVTERKKEIEQLKQVLEKEKVRASSAKKNAEVEKKNAAEAWKHVEAEKYKADEERRRANVEGKKAEEYRLQLESLCKEADNAKSKLVAEVLKSEDLSQKLEAKKKKLSKEKKRADSMMTEVREQRKLAEANRKQAEEEKCCAENLSQQLEEARQTIVGLKKEISDCVCRYSEADGKIGEMQKQIEDLQSSRKPVEASAVQPDKYLKADSGKVKLLKKQLKFEKMRIKHAKQVAELENNRNSILHQELHRLKLDFIQFLHRLDVVDKCFSPNAVDNLGKEKDMDYSKIQSLKLKEKLHGLKPFQMHLQSENELLKPCFTEVAASCPLRQTIQNISPSLSLYGGICSESMSGTDPKLESLLGGSNQKMLQSSAINSSSASFSDRQLMGSQERGAFSVTTSSKLIEESLNAQATISSMSGEVNRVRSERKLAVDAENSVRGARKLGITRKVNGPSRKRKGILNVMESVALLQSEDRKLNVQMENKICDLHNILDKQDKLLEEANHTVPNLHDTSYVKHERFPKKRKVSQEENLGIQHLCDGGEMKKTENVDAKGHEDARFFKQTLGPQPANNLVRTSQACTEGIRDSVVSVPETMMNFEDVENGNYMKLLDLDNPADEECYRTATVMPLSPTLPHIEFRATETFEPLAEERFYKGLSREKENPVPSCSYDVINVEIVSNKFTYNVSGNSFNSLPYKNESSLDSNDLKVNSTMQTGNTCYNLAWDFGMAGQISELCRSGDEGVKFPSENELGPTHDIIPQHFVVFHNIKDEHSVSRILHATKTCLARCSLVLQTEWMLQKILLALKMEDHLLSMEKACVFFSMLLLNFSTVAQGKSKNSLESDINNCLVSFASHVSAVMSNSDARSAFDELCLDELLSLIEKFLMDGKVITCTVASSDKLSEHNSKINILVDGVNTMLSTEAASAAQLVAGSIILASISAATDRIGFICEASYNIFRVHLLDLSLVLTILHIFAYLGGEIFTSKKYNLIMMSLKSIVMSLEKGCLSVAANSSISSASEIQDRFHPCAECPFSKDAVSVEIAMSLLLEKLWRFAQSGTVNLLSHKDQVAESCQESYCLLDINCDSSCFLNKHKMPANQSKSVADMTLCHVTDVLSLVELLACLMRWDWTCNTVIPELLKMLESPIEESFIIAIIVLLSQLGRHGVDACGYEDKDVESLRNNLSAFLWWETTSRAGLPLQIATATALLGLVSLNFEQVIQINVMSSSFGSQSVPVDSIRKWFSKLSKEHQALSFSMLQSSSLVPKLR